MVRPCFCGGLLGVLFPCGRAAGFSAAGFRGLAVGFVGGMGTYLLKSHLVIINPLYVEVASIGTVPRTFMR